MSYSAFAEENFVFITQSDITTLDGYVVPTYNYAESYEDAQFGTQYVYRNSDLFLPESILQQHGFVITWDKKTHTLHIKPKENFTQKSPINHKTNVSDLQEVFRPVVSNIKVYAGDKDVFPITAYHNGKEMMISIYDLYHYFGTMEIDSEKSTIHFNTKSTVPAVVTPTGQSISLKDNIPRPFCSLVDYYVKEDELYLHAYKVSYDDQPARLYLCFDKSLLKYADIKPTIDAGNMTLSATKPFTLPMKDYSLLQGPEYIHTVNCHLFNKNHEEIVSHDNYPVFFAMNSDLYIRADKLQEALS